MDSRGRPSTICPYKRPFLGGITHAIFRTAGRASKLVTSSFATADSSPFYFAGDAGAFAFATDAGQCVDAIGGLGASVAAMLYDEGCDVLVMLLTNSVLATFKLTDNKPAPLNKVRGLTSPLHPFNPHPHGSFSYPQAARACCRTPPPHPTPHHHPPAALHLRRPPPPS